MDSILSFEPGLAIWTIITFLVLLIILGKTAWPKILAALNERENSIRSALADAEKAREEADRSIADTKEMLNEARKESAGIVQQGVERAEKVREDLIAKAGDEARALIERTKHELELEREKAVSELKNRAVDLSVAIAAKIITSSLTPEQQEELARRSIKNLESNL